MAIKPADLFSYEPGQTLDFSGISPAAIFNRSTYPRYRGLMDSAGMSDEDSPVAPAAISPETLFPEQDDPELIPSPRPQTPAYQMPTETDDGDDFSQPIPPAPASPVAPGTYEDFADFMFQSEARFDDDGNLSVYEPPSGDGGGAYEVAGITVRYQPDVAANLRSLIEGGHYAEAEKVAKDFYRQRAAPFTSLTSNPGLQLQLADTVHHRGEGGLRRVLQRASSSDSEDYGALIKTLEENSDPLSAFHSARQEYEWVEVDRGRESRQKFRKGLQNRFNKANAAARALIPS